MRAQNRLIIAQCYTWIRVLWLVHIAATSSINYCNVFYVGLPLKHTQQLHLGLNGAAHLLAGNACDMHTECRYSSLHWLPTGFQVQCKILILSIWGLCTCPVDDSGIRKSERPQKIPSLKWVPFASDLLGSCYNIACLDGFEGLTLFIACITTTIMLFGLWI